MPTSPSSSPLPRPSPPSSLIKNGISYNTKQKDQLVTAALKPCTRTNDNDKDDEDSIANSGNSPFGMKKKKKERKKNEKMLSNITLDTKYLTHLITT